MTGDWCFVGLGEVDLLEEERCTGDEEEEGEDEACTGGVSLELFESGVSTTFVFGASVTGEEASFSSAVSLGLSGECLEPLAGGGVLTRDL